MHTGPGRSKEPEARFPAPEFNRQRLATAAAAATATPPAACGLFPGPDPPDPGEARKPLFSPL